MRQGRSPWRSEPTQRDVPVPARRYSVFNLNFAWRRDCIHCIATFGAYVDVVDAGVAPGTRVNSPGAGFGVWSRHTFQSDLKREPGQGRGDVAARRMRAARTGSK